MVGCSGIETAIARWQSGRDDCWGFVRVYREGERKNMCVEIFREGGGVRCEQEFPPTSSGENLYGPGSRGIYRRAKILSSWGEQLYPRNLLRVTDAAG